MSIDLMREVPCRPLAQRLVNEPVRNIRNFPLELSPLARRVWHTAALTFSYLTGGSLFQEPPDSMHIPINRHFQNIQNMIHRVSSVARQIWDGVLSPPLYFCMRMLSLQARLSLDMDTERNLVTAMTDAYKDNNTDLFRDLLNNNPLSYRVLEELVNLILLEQPDNANASDAFQQVINKFSTTELRLDNESLLPPNSYMDLIEVMINSMLLNEFHLYPLEQERQLARLLTVTLPVLEANGFSPKRLCDPILSLWSRAIEKARQNNRQG